MSKVKPQVVEDEDYQRVHDRVAAVDVAKDAGVVCTRTAAPARPGARHSAIWTVTATVARDHRAGPTLTGDGVEMVTMEATSGLRAK